MPGGSAQRPGYVLAGLGRFGSGQGWGPAPPLGPEVAEAFVVAGLPGRAASTKGTYRSVLRSLGGPSLRGPGRPGAATPFSASPAKAPYSAEERPELFALAASQRQAGRRTSALAALLLGIGAGLRAGELAAATGDDVIASPRAVAVRLGTGAGRVVPVSGVYAPALARLAQDAGTGHLFCPGGATGPTRTSSTTSATRWRQTRPPRGFVRAGPVPALSATTWRWAHLCGNCSI